MTPYKVTFFLYAESDEEINDLQRALYELVSEAYNEGIYARAEKLTRAIRNNKNLIKAFLR